MIFDTIKYGTFTADDFINAHTTNDFSKFTQLPIDLRKKFISDVIDLHPNQESNNFKQAAFDFLDGKIDRNQFRDACHQYWQRAAATVVAAAVVVVAPACRGLASAPRYRPYFEQHASHLNKLIKEYETCQ